MFTQPNLSRLFLRRRPVGRVHRLAGVPRPVLGQHPSALSHPWHQPGQAGPDPFALRLHVRGGSGPAEGAATLHDRRAAHMSPPTRPGLTYASHLAQADVGGGHRPHARLHRRRRRTWSG